MNIYIYVCVCVFSPINETIDIISRNVYHHQSLPPPSIEKETLKELLLACTTESPFRCPNNKMYYQINGIAMGSCLAPTFADFYMCDLENKVLSNININLPCFASMLTIFTLSRNEEHLQHLKRQFEENSVLNFTPTKLMQINYHSWTSTLKL